MGADAGCEVGNRRSCQEVRPHSPDKNRDDYRSHRTEEEVLDSDGNAGNGKKYDHGDHGYKCPTRFLLLPERDALDQT